MNRKEMNERINNLRKMMGEDSLSPVILSALSDLELGTLFIQQRRLHEEYESFNRRKQAAEPEEFPGSWMVRLPIQSGSQPRSGRRVMKKSSGQH